ncbi:5-guanidino-2-oxopentanoate decarboxylase [Pseudooceanicola algae]|uniref:Putative 2-ketoarginine decarboxylase AruI n=1 Tax=Pseudooceanicola algae TaxID=1537215 RepID=A0A418SHP2_9RHOB|nr:5-guanidino-2-oxopentanoate decarboxylase [Pseudooceanicola algae]QPM90287.1 putative 2-ketoarginine decarboxylase AruI [Pseudooceanicola algae]
MTRKLGTILPALLAARGVEMVFGIPGVHTVEMYRGLPESGIRHITPRHEQGAGFMADGYARAAGKPGVCFIISGPGMTNIMTAMGQAYGDSIPMLVISTVINRDRMGKGEGWLHEMQRQSDTVSGVAAFSRTVLSPDELEPALDAAFAVFTSARPRPVHIEIPVDVLEMELTPRAAAPQVAPAPEPSAASLDAALVALEGAHRPVILAGGGAQGADVVALAEALDAPVVMTTNGRGLLPPDHPLAVPFSPSLPEVRAMIAGADVALALGTEFGSTDYDFNEDGGFVLPGTLIRVDLDPGQVAHGANDRTVIGLLGEAGATAARLIRGLTPRKGDGAARAAQGCAALDAFTAAMQSDFRLLGQIRDRLPGARIVGDSTQIVYTGNSGFAAAQPGGYFNSATGFGTLGYGLPAAIGAALADGGPAVAITGDGGLQFCLGELTSAVEAQARVIMLLHDNQGYGEIRSYMEGRDIPTIGVDILTPDLCAIVAACGWQVIRAAETGFAQALEQAAEAETPVMIYLDEVTRRSL